MQIRDGGSAQAPSHQRAAQSSAGAAVSRAHVAEQGARSAVRMAQRAQQQVVQAQAHLAKVRKKPSPEAHDVSEAVAALDGVRGRAQATLSQARRALTASYAAKAAANRAIAQASEEQRRGLQVFQDVER